MHILITTAFIELFNEFRDDFFRAIKAYSKVNPDSDLFEHNLKKIRLFRIIVSALPKFKSHIYIVFPKGSGLSDQAIRGLRNEIVIETGLPFDNIRFGKEII